MGGGGGGYGDFLELHITEIRHTFQDNRRSVETLCVTECKEAHRLGTSCKVASQGMQGLNLVSKAKAVLSSVIHLEVGPFPS